MPDPLDPNPQPLQATILTIGRDARLKELFKHLDDLIKFENYRYCYEPIAALPGQRLFSGFIGAPIFMGKNGGIAQLVELPHLLGVQMCASSKARLRRSRTGALKDFLLQPPSDSE